jgi:phospholipid/cholesterol/gamma-HCH transport system substrate-binding protein
VSAQILPKTLFGEQYVALSIPTDPGAHIKAGDVIPQDRSQGALETEQVLGDTLPLLNALEPAELNTTLTAMAQALSGRGQALGQTLVELDRYLQAMNRTSPTGSTYTGQLIADLKSLGQVATLYNDSAPNIVATLQNLQVSNNTIISRQAALSQLLDVANSTSNVLGNFLQANKQSLITVSGTTDRLYGLLKEYSPEFGCIFSAMSQLEDKTSNTIRNGSIQLSITIDQQPSDLGAYKPGDQPKLVTGYGPNCFGLPDNVTPTDGKGNFETPPQFQCMNDGAAMTTAACSQDAKADAGYSLQSEGSAPETAMINSLIASTYGTTPARVPAVATILAAPALRGSAVRIK